MKNLDLKDFLKEYTDDKGVTDFEKANSELTKQFNASTNSLLKKEKEKANSKQEEFKKATIEEFTTSDNSEYVQLQKQLKTITQEMTELKTNEQQRTNDFEVTTQKNKILTKGFSDPTKVEFIQYKLSKAVNEDNDFDSLLDSYVKTDPPQKTGTTWLGNNGVVEERSDVKEFQDKMLKKLT